MPEYCTAADLQNRLTAAGYGNVVDRDQDGEVSPDETSSSVTSSISWAGSLIDSYLCSRFDINSARSSGNGFLKDRAVDLAAYRLTTSGGRDSPNSFRQDYEQSLQLLERIRDAGDPIPGLTGTTPDWKLTAHEVFEIPSIGVT